MSRSGVLVVDKPRGPTSHDVVARVRKALGTRQVGHAGTLDPMATGVLVIAVDEATKLVPYLTADDKGYEATLALGVATDTLDAEGKETERVAVPDAVLAALDVTNGYIARALEAERARTSQIPPVFSAIRVAGERAHELARRGETPDLAPRSVAVKRLEVVGGGLEPLPHLRLALDVTKGYFVRSLARDLAAALGTVGHLTALRRVRSGAFPIAGATPLDGDLAAALVPLPDAARRALPASVLTAVGALAASRGQRVAVAEIADPHPSPSAWFDESGRLVAIGEVNEDGGRVLRGFVA
jgi:tRNA pseudouridine55 synthase